MRRIHARFDQIDRNFERVWEEFRELRRDLTANTRQMAQIGWALVGALVIQVIAVVIAFA